MSSFFLLHRLYIISLCYILSLSLLSAEIATITSQELNEGMQNGLYAAIIDVRSQEDWDTGHIPNATLVASLNTMTLPPIPVAISSPSCDNSNQTIVVTCRTGARARVAAEKLVAAGYKATVLNGGGTSQWVGAGYSLVKTDSVKSCKGESSGSAPMRLYHSPVSFLIQTVVSLWVVVGMWMA